MSRSLDTEPHLIRPGWPRRRSWPSPSRTQILTRNVFYDSREGFRARRRPCWPSRAACEIVIGGQTDRVSSRVLAARDPSCSFIFAPLSVGTSLADLIGSFHRIAIGTVLRAGQKNESLIARAPSTSVIDRRW